MTGVQTCALPISAPTTEIYTTHNTLSLHDALPIFGVDHHHFEDILDDHKDRNGYELDTDLSADDWAELVDRYKERLEEELGEPFPQDPAKQLWGAIGAVFGSWMNQRAITYRRLHNIPESWGTAVNVQAMVFGNMGATSATGAAVALAVPPISDRKSTRLNSSHCALSRMPSSA